MRLNRYLAACGFGSRRKCETFILNGDVSVNGSFVDNLATQVADGDDVRVNGRRAVLPTTTTLIALHKPRGYVTTREDELDRKCVYDLLPPHYRHLHYIGRLDKDSEGLLLFTNDGTLAQRTASPRHKIEKEYEVLLDKPVEADAIEKLLAGFHIEPGRARMDKIRRLGPSRFHIVLTQGLKRQIRLMFYELGYDVKRLKRIRIGSILLGTLCPKEWCLMPQKAAESLGGKFR